MLQGEIDSCHTYIFQTSVTFIRTIDFISSCSTRLPDAANCSCARRTKTNEKNRLQTCCGTAAGQLRIGVRVRVIETARGRQKVARPNQPCAAANRAFSVRRCAGPAAGGGRRLPWSCKNFPNWPSERRENARIHASGFQTLKAQHVESRLITIAALFEYCIDADTSLRKLSVFSAITLLHR